MNWMLIMSGLSWAVHATVSLAASVAYLVVAASVVHLAVSPPASPPGPDLLGKLAQHIAKGISFSYLGLEFLFPFYINR